MPSPTRDVPQRDDERALGLLVRGRVHVGRRLLHDRRDGRLVLLPPLGDERQRRVELLPVVVLAVFVAVSIASDWIGLDAIGWEGLAFAR